jgi:hypothetical protein
MGRALFMHLFDAASEKWKDAVQFDKIRPEKICGSGLDAVVADKSDEESFQGQGGKFGDKGEDKGESALPVERRSAGKGWCAARIRNSYPPGGQSEEGDACYNAKS